MPGTAPSCGRDDHGAPGDVVRIEGLTFAYGAAPVVRDVSFGVPAGAFLALLGPSGCGKTTLLKLLGGYLTPASGRVHLRRRDVTALPPERRNVGMVFQSYALFPHLTARRNVAFGLEVRGMPRAERERRVEAMLALVGLTGAERDRKPDALSGGQQQRVALARALVFAPDLLLLDEPLANLDRHLRDQLRSELRRLQRETGVTAVLVTHDQEEALAVSDLVGVMAGGRLLQLGTPADVYHRPRTPFVARFLGAANLLPAAALGGGQPHKPEAPARAGEVPSLALQACVAAPAPKPEAQAKEEMNPSLALRACIAPDLERPVLVRPEGIVLGPAADACLWSWSGRVVSTSFLGADVLAAVVCDVGTIQVRARPCAELAPGQEVRVGVPAEAAWAIPDFDPDEVPT
jgi:ABC-type Fe3+/spermidine/putrescine transport system ATPase subunit